MTGQIQFRKNNMVLIDNGEQVDVINLKIKAHSYFDHLSNSDHICFEYEGPYRPDLVGACIKRFILPTESRMEKAIQDD